MRPSPSQVHPGIHSHVHLGPGLRLFSNISFFPAIVLHHPGGEPSQRTASDGRAWRPGPSCQILEFSSKKAILFFLFFRSRLSVRPAVCQLCARRYGRGSPPSPAAAQREARKAFWVSSALMCASSACGGSGSGRVQVRYSLGPSRPRLSRLRLSRPRLSRLFEGLFQACFK